MGENAISELFDYVWVPVSALLFYFFKKRDGEIDLLARQVSEHKGRIDHNASKLKYLGATVEKISETQVEVLSKVSSINAHLEHQTKSLNRLEDRFLNKHGND